MKFIIAIFTIISLSSYALSPLEGIILGQVDNANYKLASNFNGIKAGPKIDEIKQFLLRGESLENSCLAGNIYTYNNKNDENIAKSTIIANLQYLGINLSLRAIVSHAKALMMSSKDFDTLSKNLVSKTCSANFSVYSKKLLLNNFKKLFNSKDKDLLFKFDHLYLASSMKREIESRDFIKSNLDYSIRNFRSFCSWDGDNSDYRLIGKYLEDRYTMAYLESFITSQDSSKKVLCEDSICREVNTKYMLKNIPRVAGSIKLSEDLRLLYCNKFSMNKKPSLNKQIKKWQLSETKETRVKEVLNFNSLLNGTPNLSLLRSGMDALKSVLDEKVAGEWSAWAKSEMNNFSLDLLYEEALQIDLVNTTYSADYYQGKLKLNFQYSLGELDLLSNELNKLSSTFTIKLNKKFIKWFYNKYFNALAKKDTATLSELEGRLNSVLAKRFQEKEKYFNLKVWTKDVSLISSKELIRQMSLYRGSELDFDSKKDEDFISLEVNLRFGIFALKYFKEKSLLNMSNLVLTAK